MFEKSFMAIWPRGRVGADSVGAFCWDGWGLKNSDFARLANGLGLSGLLRALIAWFWMASVRLSRHERLAMRSARMDSMGVVGVSSSSIWS